MDVHQARLAPDRLADHLAHRDRANERRQADLEQASRMLPSARSAARSEKERQLLTEIFDSIPKVLTLSEAHSVLEDAGRESDLAERRWVRALAQVQAKLNQLINLPVESAGDAHRRLTIWREVYGMIELPEAKKTLNDLDREDLHVVADAALKAIRSLANPKPTAADRIWSEALDRFLKADASHRDPALSDDDWDHATDRASELEGQLHRTPAPTIAALAEKMRLTLKIQLEDHKEDNIDDPRTIAVGLADSDCVVREQVLAYQDALRLAGLRPEVAAATAFDPVPFVAAADAAGVNLAIGESEDGFSLSASFLTEDAPADLRSVFQDLRQGELAVIKSYLHDQRRTSIQ